MRINVVITGVAVFAFSNKIGKFAEFMEVYRFIPQAFGFFW